MTPMITFMSPKDKLPKGFTYPLSRSDVDAAVEGKALPELVLSFTRYATPVYLQRTSWYRRRLSIPILFGRYQAPRWTPTALTPDSAGAYGRWYVHVYCVPRDLRSTIRERLTTSSLDEFFGWIGRDRSETWHFHHHEMTVYFNGKTGNLVAEESDSAQ